MLLYQNLTNGLFSSLILVANSTETGRKSNEVSVHLEATLIVHNNCKQHFALLNFSNVIYLELKLYLIVYYIFHLL